MTKETGTTRARTAAKEIMRTRPFQCGLPDYFCTGENYDIIALFCAERFGERPISRNISSRWEAGGAEFTRLYCFRTKDQADLFARHFEAARYDDPQGQRPETTWAIAGSWSTRIRYGPLGVPAAVRANP